MAKKDKKKKKSLQCIDCENKSSDYYTVATNRGNIIKCAKCYELWIWRSTRMSYGATNNIGKSTSNWDD